MPWYKHWFSDDGYMEMYAHRDGREAGDAVSLFRNVSQLPEGSLVLDLACGSGRHASELAQAGYTVTAADLSATLLNLARKHCASAGNTPLFVRTDMLSLPFQFVFHAAVQLFTAFGYFLLDEQNEEVLRQVHRSLLSGGLYMLDFLNAREVEQNLVPFSEAPIAGGSVIQERSIRGGRVEKRITLLRGGRTQTFMESVRLYSMEDLSRMLERSGFGIERLFGNYGGEAFADSSPRCILFARKK
jgi:ubiquinone/menaquinone biosynthesis C-methylase UbiE